MDGDGLRVARRRLLQMGTLGLAGVTLPRLLWADAQRAAVSPRPRADACILIFLNGGPSQPDMWDLKPDAPDDIRSTFKPIATSLPGVQFSECLPRLARHMHRSALVRSVNHLIGHAHGAAVYTALTGHDRGDTTMITPTGPNDHPAIGSVASLLRPSPPAIVPFVNLPYATTEGIGGPPQAGFFGGLLGKRYDPLCVLKDPNAADFSVPELTLPTEMTPDRFGARKSLLDTLDDQHNQRPLSSAGGHWCISRASRRFAHVDGNAASVCVIARARQGS